MGNMTWTVVDAATGAPIPNAEITAIYNTSPCAWDAWGCTSGNGQSIQGYTDANGNYQWSIPFTCAGSFTNNVAQANGYNAQTIQSQAFGSNPGSLGMTFQMTSSSATPPPGQGASSILTAIEAAFGYQQNQAAGSATSFLNGAGLTVDVVFIAVAIIAVAVVVVVIAL